MMDCPFCKEPCDNPECPYKEKEMKRTEMVKDMVTELKRWQDQDAKFGGGFEDCMSSILKMQEVSGMMPPAEYNEQDREAKVHCNNAERWMKWED